MHLSIHYSLLGRVGQGGVGCLAEGHFRLKPYRAQFDGWPLAGGQVVSAYAEYADDDCIGEVTGCSPFHS